MFVNSQIHHPNFIEELMIMTYLLNEISHVFLTFYAVNVHSIRNSSVEKQLASKDTQPGFH